MKRLLKSKRITAGILFAAITSNMLGTLAYGVTSSNEVYFKVGESSYVINGVEQKMDSAAIIHNSRTMVPMRYAAEAFGAKVNWSQETRTATIIHGEKEIRLPLDENVIYAGDKVIEMDTKAVVIEGRTMLPLAYIAQSLGLETSWNGETRTVRIVEEIVNRNQEKVEEDIEDGIDENVLEDNLYIEGSVSKVFDINAVILENFKDGTISVSVGMSNASANIKSIVRPKGDKPPTKDELMATLNTGMVNKGRYGGYLLFAEDLTEVVKGENILYMLSYDIDGVEGASDLIVSHEFEYPIKD